MSGPRAPNTPILSSGTQPSRSSGTYEFRPAFADWIIEAYERIQIPPPVLDDPSYIISARRSANLLLQDMGANRGCNLWSIGDETLNIPMVGGQESYILPDNVVYLLDSYIRTYTPNPIYREIGHSPTFARDEHGVPMLEDSGEPIIVSPGSEVFWTQEGSPYITMRWPGHGLMPGAPIFFRMPIAVGSLTLTNFVIVARVIDRDTLTFVAPEPARATRHGCGATALFVATVNQRHITVILPHHGYTIGDRFPVTIPTDVGGIRLHGEYSVVSTIGLHKFQIPSVPGLHWPDTKENILSEGSEPQDVNDSGRVLDMGVDSMPRARFTESVYENGGALVATSQAPGVHWTDVILWPISRNDYSALPNKTVEGRPSVFWFDRTIERKLYLWAAPARGHHWGFITYRMRYLEDADPTSQLDLPRRFWPAFTAQLTASLAEKYNPAVFQQKFQLAEVMWERAAAADREMVGTFITPTLQPYFRGGY